jgi:hypothetical protein
MTRSSLSQRLTCRRCPSHHSLPPPQLPQSSDACAVNTAAARTLGPIFSSLLSHCAGHISRLQLVLNELRVPWKEYLRQKREEEQRSVEFKRQADGAPPPPHSPLPTPPSPLPPPPSPLSPLTPPSVPNERLQRLQFSPAPTVRISPAPL